VYVDVPYYEQGDVNGWKEGFWGDQVDSGVVCVAGAGDNEPQGVKIGLEKRFQGGDIEGKAVVHPFEPLEYRIEGKKRPMNIGRHSRGSNRRKKGLKGVAGGKVSLADMRLL